MQHFHSSSSSSLSFPIESPDVRRRDLYSGALYVVHSYLSFTNLLILSRTSHYYRNVAIGIINPSGLRRMGYQIPFIAWDATLAATATTTTTNTATTATSSASSTMKTSKHGEISSNQSSLRSSANKSKVPSFVKLAQASPYMLGQTNLDQSTGNTNGTATAASVSVSAVSSSSPSSASVNIPEAAPSSSVVHESNNVFESVLSMIPAPDYGTPSESRRVKFNPQLHSIDRLLLSPIIGRHMQELTIDETITDAGITLISLRFPHIKVLHINSLSFSASYAALSSSKFPASWGITGLRLPSKLRVLRINGEISPADAFQSILNLLPLQCPLLQALENECQLIGAEIAKCDLSPLLALPHLTHLTTAKQHRRDLELPSVSNSAMIIRQLTQLKHLNLWFHLNDRDVKLYLSPAHTHLREFIISGFSDAILQAIADRTPHLYSMDEDLGNNPNEWFAVDHSSLLKFKSLRTLRYGQRVRQHGRLTGEGEDCVAFHGSLDAYVNHVVSIFSQLHTLTCLKLESLYIPIKARSIYINKEYFQQLNLYQPPQQQQQTRKQKQKQSQDGSIADASMSMGSAVTESTQREPMTLSLHPIIQLVPHLPLLVELSLKYCSARHLSSLSFLSHLPHLQSLSLIEAHYLPIESMYDLRHVSSTLTHLKLIDCFPVDSHGRSVYLLHDILQPLQLSYPVTEAVTIQFPDSMKTPNPRVTTSSSKVKTTVRESISNGDSKTAVYAFNVPVPIPTVNIPNSLDSMPSSSSTSSFSTSSTSISTSTLTSTSTFTTSSPLIPPRHSNWYEIRRFPLPSPSSKVASAIQIAKFESPEPGRIDKKLMEYAKAESQRLKEKEAKDRAISSRIIFDSFTANALPRGSESRTHRRQQQQQQEIKMTHHEVDDQPFQQFLTSKLLPQLQRCEIEHLEPNQLILCFTYDRSEQPRHRLEMKGQVMFEHELWTKNLRSQQQQMHKGYELSMDANDKSVDFIPGFQFNRILHLVPLLQPLVRGPIEE